MIQLNKYFRLIIILSCCGSLLLKGQTDSTLIEEAPVLEHQKIKAEFESYMNNPANASKIKPNSFLTLVDKEFKLISVDESLPKLNRMILKLALKLNIKVPSITIYGLFGEKHQGSARKSKKKSDLDKKILLEQKQVNAFAWSVHPNIGFVFIGKKLIEILSDDELEAVIAHELSHVYYNHVMQQLATNIVISPFILKNILTYKTQALFVPAFISCGCSRAHERQADEKAAEIIDNPRSAANALDKISKAVGYKESRPKTALGKGLKFVEGIFSSHPSIHERKKYLNKLAKKRGL